MRYRPAGDPLLLNDAGAGHQADAVIRGNLTDSFGRNCLCKSHANLPLNAA